MKRKELSFSPTDLSHLAASFYFPQFRLGVLFVVIGMRVGIVPGSREREGGREGGCHCFLTLISASWSV